MGALLKIRQAGFALGFHGGGLSVTPASQLTSGQRDFIKRHKAEIIEELKQEVAYFSTVSKCVEKINKLTNQVIETEKEISKLDIFQQNILIGKINHQRLINDHLEQGSSHAAGVYHQLMLNAKNNLSKIDVDGEGIQAANDKGLIDYPDDRHYCHECQKLINGRCIAQRFRPLDDRPRRCSDFMSTGQG